MGTSQLGVSQSKRLPNVVNGLCCRTLPRRPVKCSDTSPERAGVHVGIAPINVTMFRPAQAAGFELVCLHEQLELFSLRAF